MKRCLGLLALLRGEPIDLGRLISKNIKYMANITQQTCEHFCIINELCRRSGVPIYHDDKMIGPKAHINALAIRRLQHNHPAGETQHDQKDNPTENEEEFYQPQVQQQPVQVQGNQQASDF